MRLFSLKTLCGTSFISDQSVSKFHRPVKIVFQDGSTPLDGNETKARAIKSARGREFPAKATPLQAQASRAAVPLGEGAARSPGRPPMMDDPRTEILQQAARLFAQKGYLASSLNELASAMSYSKGAIYNYFASKQEIYDAIIIDTLTGLYESGVAAVKNGDSPTDQLRCFMIAHATFLAYNFDAFATMLVGFSGMADTHLKADALALRDAHEGLLRRIIMDGIADSSFRAVDPAMTGRAVLSLLSWMVRWFRPGGGKSAEDVALDYYDLIVKGLTA